jgi:transcription elongation factor GreB
MASYITRQGAKTLAEELNRLLTVERPKVVREVADAAAQGDRSENAEYIYGKKRLREIDRRLHFLTRRLDEVEVVSHGEAPQEADRVFFGAIVVVEEEGGPRKQYQLVGPDEADPARGLLSYQSPLGKTLMKRKLGEILLFQRPAGEVELEIVEIRYPTP